MGTYQISPAISLRSITGNWGDQTFANPGAWNVASDNASKLAGINGTSSVNRPFLGGSPLRFPSFALPNTLAALIIFDYDLGSSVISLDGNPNISFNGLPVGFTLQDAKLSIDVWSSSISGDINGVGSRGFLQLGPYESQALIINNTISTLSFVYPTSPVPSILGVLLNGFGIRCSYIANDGVLSIFNARITGNYTTLSASTSFTFPLSTGIKAGDKFTINNINAPSGSIGLGAISSIHIQYKDSSNIFHDIEILAQDFIFWSDTQIVFYFPEFGNFTGTVYIYAYPPDPSIPFPNIPQKRPVGPSSPFSGPILLGTLTVTYVDASGLYVLIPNKQTDTVYDRTGTTKEVAIQDPIIETAFIP